MVLVGAPGRLCPSARERKRAHRPRAYYRDAGLAQVQEPGGTGPSGSRECPLSWDLNVVERVSVADRAAPWVFIFSPGNTEGGCDYADHTERAANGCYAEEGDEAEQRTRTPPIRSRKTNYRCERY